MDRKSKNLIYASTLLIVVIVVLSVVWAGYTSNLTINGSATVGKANWSVVFQNLQDVQLGNDDGVTTGATETEEPEITGDISIGDFGIALSKPGDYAIYEFTIKNNGTFDAKVDTGFSIPEPICTKGSNGVDADATNVCNNLTYTLTYKDGGATVQSGDTIAANGSRVVQLKLYYSKNATQAQLPKDTVTVSNLGITIPFTQV